MARLKLNLSTGANVEKNVVTSFNVNEKTYLVLDAENNGSMGLPIILVCKIDNGKVVKIVDAAEWQQAKDYLKGIIAGNTMNYVPVAAEMPADEIYYTQLTLPVASFDVIKNSYKVEGNIEVVPVASAEPVAESVIPETNIVAPEAPAIDIVVAPEAVVAPEVSPVEPVIPEMPVNEPAVSNVESAPATSGEMDYNEIKATFMKACENMFDALVSKFQAELDSKK